VQPDTPAPIAVPIKGISLAAFLAFFDIAIFLSADAINYVAPIALSLNKENELS
jgi:hypothetical protein